MNQTLRFPAALVALPFTLCFAGGAQAQTARTWNGGPGDWSNDSLWTPAGAPNSAAADAAINKSSPTPLVRLDGAFSVGRLTVYPGTGFDNDAPLQLAGDATLTIVAGAFAGSGQLVNNANITSVATSLTTPTAGFQLSGAITFTGSGRVRLENRIISGLAAGSRLTINDRQSVEGAGNIGNGSLQLTNDGFIVAERANAPLVIQPTAGTTMLNTGTLTATGGGRLELSSGAAFKNSHDFEVHGATENRDTIFSIAPGALTNFSGTTLTGGSYLLSTFSAGRASLSLGGGAIVTNNAFVTLIGPGWIFEEIKALADNRACFIVRGASENGHFTTAGSLNNSGVITSNKATLTVKGAFTQTEAGVLNGAGLYQANSFRIAGEFGRAIMLRIPGTQNTATSTMCRAARLRLKATCRWIPGRNCSLSSAAQVRSTTRSR